MEKASILLWNIIADAGYCENAISRGDSAQAKAWATHLGRDVRKLEETLKSANLSPKSQ